VDGRPATANPGKAVRPTLVLLAAQATGATAQAAVPAVVVVPNLGLPALKWQFLDGLGIDETKTTLAWGHRIGHLGAGDHLAALDHLITTEAVHSGDQILLAATGIGFTWSGAVLQMM
jgi:3-oxoacyl-[acyl-carrier-protein] synthase-3